MFGWPRNILCYAGHLIFDSESRRSGKTCHDINLLFDVAQHRLVRHGYSLEYMMRRTEYWLSRSDEVDVREPA